MRGLGDPGEGEELFSIHYFPGVGPWLAGDLVLLSRPGDPRTVDWSPPFSLDRAEKPASLKVAPEERAQVTVLDGRVVELVREGVTGMDLLEVFLRRRIQPLQARDHPMWLYSGLDDTTRIHPEEVTDEMMEGWLSSITGNKDNPRGARRVIPLDNSYDVDQVCLYAPD